MPKSPPVNLTVLSSPAPTADNKQKLSCQHPNGNVFNLHLGQNSAKVPTGFQGQYDFEIWEFEIPNSNGKKIWCGGLIPGASQNKPIAPTQAPQSPSQPPGKSNDTQEQILRQCAGKIAAAELAASVIKYDERFQEAERWVGYFQNGLTPNLLPAKERFGDGALQLDTENTLTSTTNPGPQNVREMKEENVPWDNS